MYMSWRSCHLLLGRGRRKRRWAGLFHDLLGNKELYNLIIIEHSSRRGSLQLQAVPANKHYVGNRFQCYISPPVSGYISLRLFQCYIVSLRQEARSYERARVRTCVCVAA
jgi:hypothetical protein